MNGQPVSPGDAARALAEVRARREQVVARTLLPDWFWAAVGGLIVGFNAAVESGRAWIIAAGSVGLAVGVAAVVVKVVVGARAQLRNELLGVRGGLAIALHVAALVAVGLGAGLTMKALDVPWPATAAGLVTAVAMALSGPVLMRYLRGMMTARPVERR
jgi:hypothetical protein